MRTPYSRMAAIAAAVSFVLLSFTCHVRSGLYPPLCRDGRPDRAQALLRRVQARLDGLPRDRLAGDHWRGPDRLRRSADIHGYWNVQGGTINPWDWQREGPVDLAVQETAYEAAFQAILGKNWLEGIFWRQWMPGPDHGWPMDTGYSPHGKPAEAVLRSWFARTF